MSSEPKKPRLDWKNYALKLAYVASERSEDPFMKVGACLLRPDHSVASLGYNGAPPGVNISWINRDERRKKVVHAEINALRYVKPGECELLACTHIPCNECLRTIAAYGIKEVVFNETYSRDMSSLNMSKTFGVKLCITHNALNTMSKEYAGKFEVVNDFRIDPNN
jgi:dCMP deaminase